MQQANLQLGLPANMDHIEGNVLCQQIAAMKFDGHDLGVAVDVPCSLYTPLLDLNYHSFAQLLTRERTPAVISTTDIVKTHESRVKTIHKASLNRLTILVNDVAMDKEGLAEAAGLHWHRTTKLFEENSTQSGVHRCAHTQRSTSGQLQSTTRKCPHCRLEEEEEDYKLWPANSQQPRFRCGCHGLHVDTGRRLPLAQQVPREQRHCVFCASDSAEDEHHFLFDCPAYSVIRNIFKNILWGPAPTLSSFLLYMIRKS